MYTDAERFYRCVQIQLVVKADFMSVLLPVPVTLKSVLLNT